MARFFAPIKIINDDKEFLTIQVGNLCGPFENNAQIEALLHKINPEGEIEEIIIFNNVELCSVKRDQIKTIIR